MAFKGSFFFVILMRTNRQWCLMVSLVVVFSAGPSTLWRKTIARNCRHLALDNAASNKVCSIDRFNIYKERTGFETNSRVPMPVDHCITDKLEQPHMGSVLNFDSQCRCCVSYCDLFLHVEIAE